MTLPRFRSAAQVLAIAFKRPPNFAPGAEYEYCNTNYALLGVIAERIDGKPLAQVMKDRLFGPLKMRHTLLPTPAVNAMPEPYSHGYLYGSSSVALVGRDRRTRRGYRGRKSRHPAAERLYEREPFLC